MIVIMNHAHPYNGTNVAAMPMQVERGQACGKNACLRRNAEALFLILEFLHGNVFKEVGEDRFVKVLRPHGLISFRSMSTSWHPQRFLGCHCSTCCWNCRMHGLKARPRMSSTMMQCHHPQLGLERRCSPLG